MLGSLAKWLRIFGFDTFYPSNEMTDDQVLQVAKSEQRLVISRDKELIARAKKHHVKTLEITTTQLDEQLRNVLAVLNGETTALLTRCTLCNTLLTSVDKKNAKGVVPPKVFETKEKFWYCGVCKKYYWMGTHYENMIQKINELRQKKSIG